MSIKEALKIITEEMRSPGEYQKAAETLREKLGESKSESDILYQQNKTLQAELEVLRGASLAAVKIWDSGETARGISSEMEDLREALNPPNAAVKTIEARTIMRIADYLRESENVPNIVEKLEELAEAELEKRGEE